MRKLEDYTMLESWYYIYYAYHAIADGTKLHHNAIKQTLNLKIQ